MLVTAVLLIQPSVTHYMEFVKLAPGMKKLKNLLVCDHKHRGKMYSI